MWELVKDFLLVSMGMGIGVVLMCILNVGKEADYEMKQLKENIYINQEHPMEEIKENKESEDN